MEKQYFLEKMPKAIFEIINNGEIINVNDYSITIEKIVTKFSATKEPIYKIMINSIPLHVNSKVSYNCVFCDRICKSYSVKSLLRRINFDKFKCTNCKEHDEAKQTKHSLKIQGNKYALGIKTKEVKNKITMTCKDLIINSLKAFRKETFDFKVDYLNRHLNCEEFEMLASKIVSINRNLFSFKYLYIQYIFVKNHAKYIPKLYNVENDTLISISSLSFVCDICGEPFIVTHLNTLKTRIRNLCCKTCLFNNKLFKPHKILNIQNNPVIYMSKFEKRLIDYCNISNILIINGPNIPYNWNNKVRTYKVDFQIRNILIEIKDMHIWHRNNLKSGKWDAKENAAIEYAKKHNCVFKLVYPSDYDNLIKNLNVKI
jgi:hypothetical protein